MLYKDNPNPLNVFNAHFLWAISYLEHTKLNTMKSLLQLALALCISMGVSAQNFDVQVSSNAFVDSLTIEIMGLDSDTVSLGIYDSWGDTVVAVIDSQFVTTDTTLYLNLDSLPDAIYFVGTVVDSSYIDWVRVVKDQNTSTTDLAAQANEVLLYPNPTTQFIHIQSNVPVEHIRVFNFLGQVVLETTTNTQTLTVNHLPSGRYFIQLETADCLVTKAFVRE